MSRKKGAPEARAGRDRSVIPAGKFKEQCLSLIDGVAATRSELVITKRGRPVARLAPIGGAPGQLSGFLRGTGEVTGDIVAPVDHGWESAR